MNKQSITAVVVLGFALNASIAMAQVTSTANHAHHDSIVVTDAVKVRASANGTVTGKQQRGAMGTLVGGPINAGGYVWWNVDYATGVDGWSAEDFMQDSTVALVPTTSNLAVAAPATPTQAPVVASSNSSTVSELLAKVQSLLAQLQVLKASQTAGAASTY